MRAHAPAAVDLGLVQGTRPLRRRVAAHLLERPDEVDRRRPRLGQDPVRRVQVLAASGRERVPVRRGDADRRSAAHGERPDRVGHLSGRPAPELDFLVRKPALVEQDDRAGFQTNDLLWAQVPSSHEARYFACSSVSWSISTPIVASLRRAISLSISSGTT